MKRLPLVRVCLGNLLPMALVVTLWIRSYRSFDSLVVYGPSAKVQCFSSILGTAQVVLTNKSVGTGWAWSFDFMSRRPFEHGYRQSFELNPVSGLAFAHIVDTDPVLLGSTSSLLLVRYFDQIGAVDSPNTRSRLNQVVLQVPYWAITMLAALVAAWRIRDTVVAWRRKRDGLCAACGYDLRASSERCPECGSMIAVDHTDQSKTASRLRNA